MKKLFYMAILVFIVLIMGCSNNESSPDERMQQYVNLWMKSDFSNMYDLLAADVRKSYPTEDYVDRYEKVYQDLEISKLEVTFTKLNEDEVKQAFEKGNVTYSLKVKMKSMAGPIEFTRDITLHKEEDRASEEEEKEDWYVEWDPGFIFPDLEEGGRIKIETSTAKRGEILDRNQMPLAINDIAYEVGVVPQQFENKETEIEQIAKLLHITEDSINKSLNASWVEAEHFVPLKIVPKNAEEQLANLLAIPAVTTVETIGRIYPAGEAAAHLTGYVGQVTAEEIEKYPKRLYKESDLIGKRGLEQLYEEKLRGTDGVTILIEKQDADQKEEIVLAEKPVEHGEHVHVTIDVNVQEKIFNTYQDRSGTAAAIQPNTGEVLALISSPSFDPNELSYGISQSKWDSLMEDKKQPFINRFTATYAPGSVIKPITAAIGLTNGTIKPEDGVTIEGLRWGKESWGDYKVKRVSTAANPVVLHSALIRSDNIYFAMKAVEMGSDKYTDGLKQFGVGEKLPLTYPFSVSQISNEGKLGDEVLLANTSYGQGEIEFSSLHMALAYSVFLNDGNMIKPNLLVDDPKSEIWVENVMNKADAELMQNYLLDVVTKGTAKAAKNEEVAIAGKTGTAELKLSHDSKGHENGWFVGYPSDSQDILIAMMMESVEDVGSSSYVAGKVAEVLVDMNK